MSCKRYFRGEGSELKKVKDYFSKIKAFAMKSSNKTKTNGKIIVTKTDSVVVGELQACASS